MKGSRPRALSNLRHVNLCPNLDASTQTETVRYPLSLYPDANP